MGTWTTRAELLADAIREPGFAATAITASAWQAGVHADATHGLVGTAVALIGAEALSSVWSPLPPCPDDKTLLRQAADLEGDVADLLRHCGRLMTDCEAARDEAVEAWKNAQAAMAEARAAENHGAAAAAQDAMEHAARFIADCNAALELLDNAKQQLAYALNCLRCVPDDFKQHYETPLDHRRHYGPLPVSGGFLTAA